MEEQVGYENVLIAYLVLLILIALVSLAQTQEDRVADPSVSCIPLLPDWLELPAQSSLRPIEECWNVPQPDPKYLLVARSTGPTSLASSSEVADAAPTDSNSGYIQPVLKK